MLDLPFGHDVGTKFNEDRSVRHFPGNTMVCVLDHSSEIYEIARTVRDEIASSAIGPFVATLPDDSLHMTAIEGVCDQVRKPEYWTTRLPLDTPLEKVDDFLEETWKKVPQLEGVHMVIDELLVGPWLALGLYPASYADDVKIRDWRDKAAELTGLRFPGHDRYRFHITLAYGIIPPTEEANLALEAIKTRRDEEWKKERFTFLVPSPSMTYFDDMLYFNSKRIPR